MGEGLQSAFAATAKTRRLSRYQRIVLDALLRFPKEEWAQVDELAYVWCRPNMARDSVANALATLRKTGRVEGVTEFRPAVYRITPAGRAALAEEDTPHDR